MIRPVHPAITKRKPGFIRIFLLITFLLVNAFHVMESRAGTQLQQNTSNTPAWTYTNTGNNHSFYIPTTAYISAGGNSLSIGDYIGVFYNVSGTLYCGGYVEWMGITTAVPAFSADAGDTNGFQTNEAIKWKIWRLANNQEYTVYASYNSDTCYFSNQGYFSSNGLSGIIALSDNIPVVLTINGLYPGICVSSAPVNLTGSPSGGTFSGAGVTGNQFNPASTSPGIHHISYTYTDSYGQTYTQSKCTSVQPPPAPNLGADKNICQGQSSVLNPGNFQVYLWSNGATTQTITVNSAGSWSVTVTNTAGCSNSDTINTNIISIQPVNLGPDLTACIGQTVSLDAGVYSGYQWSNGQTGESISVNTAGTYSVTVTAVNGCTGSDASVVNFNSPPISSFNVLSQVYVNNFTIVTYSGGAPSGALYSWNFAGGTIISGTGQGSYLIKWTTEGMKNITLSVTYNSCTSQITTNQVTVLPDLGFSQVSATFPGLTGAACAWADFDNDGDLDLLITGTGSNGNISTFYRNDGNGVFTAISSNLPGVSNGCISLADYDNDNDVDILLSGNYSGTYITYLYRNDGNFTFTLENSSLPGIINGSTAWADFDNDGKPDILISGAGTSGPVTKIFRNNGDNTFTDISANLTPVSYSSAAWADFDNDGDQDLVISGIDAGNNRLTIIYRNDNGIFTNISAGLTGVSVASVAWADYDSDGDPDLLVSGYTGSGYLTKVYRNDNGTFTDINAGLPGMAYGSASWGDFDSDGDPDILISGTNGISYFTKIFRNNNGSFVEFPAGLTGVANGGAWFGDFDNDNDLDIFVSGYNGNTATSVLYRNNGLISNTVPSVPTGLAYQLTGNNVSLTWNKSTDNQTAQNGLTYNVRVGSSAGSSSLLSASSEPVTGYRKVVASGNTNNDYTCLVKNIPDGTYYFSVQAIDNDYAGSAFATSVSFSVLPTSAFTAPSTICISDIATITYTGNASASASYTWIFGGGIIISGSGQGPYQVYWATAGTKTISLTVTENGFTSAVTTTSITVTTISVGGTVGGGGSNKCLGSSTGTLTLSGYSGTIIYWQKRVNNGSWTNISNNANIYAEVPVAAGTWNYRAAVQNGNCNVAYSVMATVVVYPQSLGGSVSGTTVICLGSSTGIMTVTGYTGQVNRWQKSLNLGPWSNISNPSLTYSETPALMGSWQYRAEIQSGPCSVAYSVPATITVNPASTGGSISGGSTICFGSSTGTFTLSGYYGTINKWQKRLNSGSWTDIANTIATYSEIPVSSGTWDYRAELQSGSCSVAYSSNVTDTVVPATAGGSVNGSSTICLGSSTGTLTLSGYAGTILNWRVRHNGGSWVNIQNTLSTYSAIPPSSGTWEYGAFVQSGGCTAAYSSSAVITVSSATAGGSINGGSNTCLGYSTGTMTLVSYSGIINKWQKRLNGGTWTDINNTSGIYSETPASAGTWDYRAEVQSGACNAAYSSVTTIIIYPLSAGGTVTGASSACYGSSTGTLTLNGNTGNVNKWQKRLNGGAWTDIINTNNTYSEIPSSTGTWEYRAAVQSGSCTVAYSAAIQIMVYDIPVGGNVEGSTVICLGESTGTMLLNGYSGTIAYWQKQRDSEGWINIQQSGNTWSEVPALPGTWKFRASVVNGPCSPVWSTEATVIVSPLPSPAVIPTGDQDLCQGTIVSSYNATEIANADEYIWSVFPAAAGSISSNSVSANVYWNSAFSGNASITVKGSNSCGPGPVSDSLIVHVYTLPVVSLPANINPCQGNQVVLDAGSFSGYSWNDGSTGETLTVTQSGNYQVTVTDSHNCQAGTMVSVTFHQAPVLNLSSPVMLSYGGSVSLDAGQGFSSYLWQNNQTTQSITVSLAGTYSVTVSNSWGCTGSGEVVVQLSPQEASQLLQLSNGWSIISTYIDPTDPLISSVFAPVSNKVTIIKDGNGYVYWPIYGVDQIGNMTIGKGYQINMQMEQMLEVSGILIIPENTPLTIPAGWSIIGYLRNSAGPVVSMFSSLTDLLLMKDGIGQVYWPAYGVNMIVNMNPGKGYQVKMSGTQVLTYPPD
ncbi:MAG: FG-GAP-like repeat-containing protein [Bacteroidia bacterium]|nr:FG-GAP-like repeat-containing protein [Bacteroidia bacterium]